MTYHKSVLSIQLETKNDAVIFFLKNFAPPEKKILNFITRPKFFYSYRKIIGSNPDLPGNW
jgi:hypothetical protein